MILKKWNPRINKKKLRKKKWKNLKLMIERLKKIMKSQLKKIKLLEEIMITLKLIKN